MYRGQFLRQRRRNQMLFLYSGRGEYYGESDLRRVILYYEGPRSILQCWSGRETEPGGPKVAG